ncbi:DUF2997 domain-containing protein [Planctellipticum variicoloris]|uniref:DUF2997 domain-containing protein n=1 Tax=Planctellipticum variicoloris TaxID=3064265 RepID=UPI00301353C3|nr:DUF2997 domain-containing protein [Planctomycetaceae bacterium SH412]
MNKTIEIIVASSGQSRVETKGFVGSECRLASRFVEQALGQQVDEQLKAEFHQSTGSQQYLKEGQ